MHREREGGFEFAFSFSYDAIICLVISSRRLRFWQRTFQLKVIHTYYLQQCIRYQTSVVCCVRYAFCPLFFKNMVSYHARMSDFSTTPVSGVIRTQNVTAGSGFSGFCDNFTPKPGRTLAEFPQDLTVVNDVTPAVSKTPKTWLLGYS